MRDTVTVTLAGARDAFDVPSPGAIVLARARVSPAGEAMRSTTGGDVTSPSFTVYMEDVAGFDDHATLTINGRVWPVKSFTRPAWPGGERHLRVVV
jgi:hypothetical protein